MRYGANEIRSLITKNQSPYIVQHRPCNVLIRALLYGRYKKLRKPVRKFSGSYQKISRKPNQTNFFVQITTNKLVTQSCQKVIWGFSENCQKIIQGRTIFSKTKKNGPMWTHKCIDLNWQTNRNWSVLENAAWETTIQISE